MQKIQLQANARKEINKKSTKELRKQGCIPAVLYGHGIKTLNLTVEQKKFEQMIKKTHGENVLISLSIDSDGSSKQETVMIRDIQYHPVSDGLLHIDFYKILLHEKITTRINIVLTGQAAGVKEGGVLDHSMRDVEVSCLPDKMPGHFEVDVTQLEIGSSIHIRDLKIPEGVEVLADPEQAIVSIVPPTIIKEEEVAVEEEPEVEGEKKEGEDVKAETSEGEQKEKEEKEEKKPDEKK
ncbi:50S ribosomal protein L25/general stress protein Ctc [bacterium]|nr:50S ribosomal protein L25/general stress protein Ctc [bacterium]